ncbi:hypothetical protein AGLY_004142 [Aphis glycines]|uniref:Uncharacterized protein n=1 Tax=Aphis glycines TaxID=307491 RepID=A0A6G0TZP4_APHGL|nr:hypothetical protein AGLY_004142 [Aphis glycines]
MYDSKQFMLTFEIQILTKFNIQIKNNNFGYFVIIQKFDQRRSASYDMYRFKMSFTKICFLCSWQIKYPWWTIMIKSKKFPVVFKKIEKNNKKVTEKQEIFEEKFMENLVPNFQNLIRDKNSKMCDIRFLNHLKKTPISVSNENTLHTTVIFFKCDNIRLENKHLTINVSYHFNKHKLIIKNNLIDNESVWSVISTAMMDDNTSSQLIGLNEEFNSYHVVIITTCIKKKIVLFKIVNIQLPIDGYIEKLNFKWPIVFTAQFDAVTITVIGTVGLNNYRVDMRGKQRTATVTTDGNTVDKITIYFPSQCSVVTSRQTELDNVLYVSDVL